MAVVSPCREAFRLTTVTGVIFVISYSYYGFKTREIFDFAQPFLETNKILY